MTQKLFGKKCFGATNLQAQVKTYNTWTMSTIGVMKSCLDLGKAKLYILILAKRIGKHKFNFGDVNHCEGGRDMGRGSGGGYGGVWLACVLVGLQSLFVYQCWLACAFFYWKVLVGLHSLFTSDGLHAFLKSLAYDLISSV